MIKGTLGFGALLVAFVEVIGFLAVHAYLFELGIPVHFGAIPPFEFAAWAMPVFNAAPPALLWCFSILIVLSYVRYVGRTVSKRTRAIYHYRSGKDVSPLVYVLSHFFGESTAAFEILIPVAQVTLFAIIALAFSDIAGTVGVRWASAAVTGQVFGTVPKAAVRDGVRLETKPGATLSPAIRKANARGTLAQVWLEDRTLYVTPIRSAAKLDTGVRSVFAVERESIATVEHKREWRPHWYAAAPPAAPIPWWQWAIPAVALAVLGLAFVLAYLQQREQSATIAEADGSELNGVPMAIGEADAILSAISNGRDILLTMRENSARRRVWLKSSAIEHGLVVSETPVPPTRTLMRNAVTKLRNGERVREPGAALNDPPPKEIERRRRRR